MRMKVGRERAWFARTGPRERKRSILKLALVEIAIVLNASDAREYTKSTAIQYRDLACDALRILPESAAKHSLMELATFAIDRTF